ncbi:MAG: filamentous hemagglutinin N-terminal domain-containing protein, partial [Solimonas sp.]
MNQRAPMHRNARKNAQSAPPQAPAAVETPRFRLAPLAVAAASLFISAHAQAANPPAFQSMLAMQAGLVKLPDGSMSKWSGAERPVIGKTGDGRDLMTIQQTQQKALLDWERFDLQTNEVLEFQQQRADWIAVNRVHSTDASHIDGEIRATGRVFILNDNGVLMGKDARVNTRQLVTGKGVSDVLVDGSTTTIVQSAEKATLNWSDMSLQAGEVLKFQQQKKEWIALNRSLAAGVTKLDGQIKADGQLYLIAPGGLSIDGKIEAQQVIASSLNIRDAQFAAGLTTSIGDGNNRFDPVFSNTWNYAGMFSVADPLLQLLNGPPPVVDPHDPLRYNVTIGRNGSINTGSRGKVMLFGPGVTNKGTINVQDEGQVVLAAGDNIYFGGLSTNGMIDVRVGAYNPLNFMRANIPYSAPSQTVTDERWQALYEKLVGKRYEIGYTLSGAEMQAVGAAIEPYLNQMQFDRTRDVGFHARNEGIINAVRGGNVDFRGFNLEQMGAVTMTSTALFRANMSYWSVVQDYLDYYNNGTSGPNVPGNGNVVFGKGSLTQITPDLDSTDAIPLTQGNQSVGSLKINSGTMHMEEDSVIYLPSGKVNVLLDTTGHVFDNNIGNSANQDNEDGARFLMERGAIIDLSGWKYSVLPMAYQQVTGKLYAAQLKDSPLQRDGALYRKEITVDRRFGTNFADWQSFDNLNQGTLAQFLIDGGSFTLNTDDDFIMKAGSVIDVSGGKVSYEAGYVNTTLLRRMDGSIIDIRYADPDELYMGLANQWVVYDPKWGKQSTYYIPLMSSIQGKYESSYEQGGNGGRIEILAPDVVLQGTVKGSTTIGRYQRDNQPRGGSFILNKAGETEYEYVSNNLLVAAIEDVLPDDFGIHDQLSDKYGNLFGEEFDYENDAPGSKGRQFDNTTLVSDDFFNRSTMGSYSLSQQGRKDTSTQPFPPLPGTAVLVENGVDIRLANGASLELNASDRMQFFGSVRTEGGNISLAGMSLEFGNNTRLDTRGSWYSDYERDEPVTLNTVPRINGGKISIGAYGGGANDFDDVKLIMPDSMVIDTSGGAWVDRAGKIKNGKGGDLAIASGMKATDELDLAALDHARAYGLGGNGALSLSVLDAIEIGGSLVTPPKDGDAPAGRGPLRLAPSFFENSGFSKISLVAPSVTIAEGTQIHASSATLKLKDDLPGAGGALPAYFAPSGTDIYDIATVTSLPIEQRPAALRRGMDIAFTGYNTIGEGALLATEAGGTVSLTGSADIAGTISTPGGVIAISANESPIVVREHARLLAQGAVLVTSRLTAPDGTALIDGQVLPGGSISLSGKTVDLQAGALLDVSGASAVFDVPTAGDNGGVVRTRRTVASNGGSILISGENISVNDATYLARAGGAGAKGGAFTLNWGASYFAQGGTAPESAYGLFSWIFDAGYVYDKQGNLVTSLFGTDLSNIDWEPIFGVPLNFAPGFRLSNEAQLIGLLQAYNAAALGKPPMLMIGDNLPPETSGPTELPQIDSGLHDMLTTFGYQFLAPVTTPWAQTRLSTARIADGGFSSFTLDASPGVIFVGDVTLGGKR